MEEIKGTPRGVRADGSVRKEIKIKPGYVARDELPTYVPPRKRDENSSKYRYKLINGHYEVVPDDGKWSLWSSE
jgi:hypothetical protein